MIYIFDDKKNRQRLYNWSSEKFGKYAKVVRPIYEFNEVREEKERQNIFVDGNTILFHESFFDADFNKHHKESLIIRQQLEEFAQSHSNFYVAFFSGSKSSRMLDRNIAYLPVSIVYQNLEYFISKSSNGITDLRYLLYGKNPSQERDLVEKISFANNALEINDLPKVKEGENILISRSNSSNRLHQIVEGAYYGMNLGNDSDEYLHDNLQICMEERKYEKIFIPLCFGSSLSDFNGLRLATHIRCTKTMNQCTPIYIYGCIGLNEMINHQYFNIFKVKNVFFIDYSVTAFKNALSDVLEFLSLDELPQEIKKLTLSVPSNYEDDHSIANEWAIYQWALTLKATDTDIEKIVKKVNSQIYFKYLQTVYSKSDAQLPTDDQLKINYTGSPKILYIDDEADKGWYEIFCNIMYDKNNLSFEHLDDELNLKTQDQIIKICIEKIKTDDIDLVILDFRLHLNDFSIKNIGEVTGLQLLKKIKKFNPGIQVIIFTASNKVWNLLELQANGADGFLLKESPELSINSSFTLDSLTSFNRQMKHCLSNTYLKVIWVLFQEIKNAFSKNPLTIKYFPKYLKAQVNGIKYQNLLLQELDAIFEILKTNNENRFSIAMIMLYKVLEYLNEIFFQKVARDKFPLFYDNSPVDYFDKNSKTWKKSTDRVDFYNRQRRVTEQVKIRSEWINSTSNKILNLADKKFRITDYNILMDLLTLSDYRNDFIHSDSSKRNSLKDLDSKDILKWSNSVALLIKSL
jgi:CheY-like chemotaxis protein